MAPKKLSHTHGNAKAFSNRKGIKKIDCPGQSILSNLFLIIFNHQITSI